MRGDLHRDPLPCMVDAGQQDRGPLGSVVISGIRVSLGDTQGMQGTVPVGLRGAVPFREVDELGNVGMILGGPLVLRHDLLVGAVQGIIGTDIVPGPTGGHQHRQEEQDRQEENGSAMGPHGVSTLCDSL